MNVSTRKLVCRCGKELILASGFNAWFITAQRVDFIATKVGWCSDPPLCPECVAYLFHCLECETRLDTRDGDPTNSMGACKTCGSHRWIEGLAKDETAGQSSRSK